jgi:hypothetical protein
MEPLDLIRGTHYRLYVQLIVCRTQRNKKESPFAEINLRLFWALEKTVVE